MITGSPPKFYETRDNLSPPAAMDKDADAGTELLLVIKLA